MVEVANHAQPHLPVGKWCCQRHVNRIVGALFKAAQHRLGALLGRFHDAHPRARHVDVSQSGHVAGFHAIGEEFHRHHRLRTDGSLCERVASPHELFGRHTLQAQSSVFQAPHLLFGVVVPLPHRFQCSCGPASRSHARAHIVFIVKIIGTLVWSMRGFALHPIDVGFEPCTRSASQVSFQSEHGPSVFPGDGSQRGGAPDGVEVHHEQCPPRTVLCLHDAALVDVGASSGIFIHWGYAKAGTIFADAIFHIARHLRERSGMVAEGFVGSDHHGFVGSPD